MSEKGRIVLGEEDFADVGHPPLQATGGIATPLPPSPASAAAPTLPAIARGTPTHVQLPGANTAGVKPGTGGANIAGEWLMSPGRSLLAASAIGVVLAWAVTEMLGIADIRTSSQTGLNAVTGLWTGVVGVMFGGTLLAFHSAAAGAWDTAGRRFLTAAAPMLGAAFLAGYLADVIYHEIVRAVLEDAFRGGSFSENDPRLYLARAIGWALFGAGIGGTIGLLNKSRAQAVNGTLGGALGGAAGGALFQFVSVNMGAGEGMSRLVGLMGIGMLIAFATRAVETARREAWLKVLAGGMAGKEFILYHLLTRIGASPECEIFLLKDPSIAKLHAQIEDQGTQRVLTAAAGATVLVNGAPVSTQVIRDGDQLQIGNTLIGYSERSIVPAAGRHV